MARVVVFGSLLVIVIAVACGDDEVPPRAMDLGSSPTRPPVVTDSTPDDAGVTDGEAPRPDGAVETCRAVSPGDPVNQLTFDDPSIAFDPASAVARFREDCLAPGRLQIVLTESSRCASGARQVVVDLPPTATVGDTLLLDGVDDVGVRFDDDDGTRFSNLGACAASTGSVRIESYDTSEAGAQQRVVLELTQLFDCSAAARDPIVVSGVIEAPLEATFDDACPGA